MFLWYWNLRDYRVGVNIPALIWLLHILIQQVLSMIWGLLNPNRHVIPVMCYIPLYSPYHSHFHPASYFLIHNSTIIVEHKFKTSISVCQSHDHELTRSTAYTQFTIQWVPHPPKIVYLPLIFTITYWTLNVVLPWGLPPSRSTTTSRAVHEWFKGKVTWSHSHSSKLTNWRI